MDDTLEIGSRVVASSVEGPLEGVIFSLEKRRGFCVLEKVVNTKTGKQRPGLLNIQTKFIVSVVVENSSQKSYNVDGAPESVFCQPIQCSVSEKFPEESCRVPATADAENQLCDSVLRSEPDRSSSLPAGKCFSAGPGVTLTSTDSSLPFQPDTGSFVCSQKTQKSDVQQPLRTLAVYKIPQVRSTAFGGVDRDEDGQITSLGTQNQSRILPVDYVVIDCLTDFFENAIEDILERSCVGLAMEGIDIGRKGQLGWVQIATPDRVFLFDMVALGDGAFNNGLKRVMECLNVQKVVHDCRGISDLLYHRYQISIINVFDTQVADVMVYRSLNRNHFPHEITPLTICLLEHLSVSIEQIYSQHVRENSTLKDSCVWCQRPASQLVLDMAAVRVMYLLELRIRLIEKMLTDFTDGVDVYLGLHRDATTMQLTKMQSQVHLVPSEFLELSQSAVESRKRAAALRKVKPQAPPPVPVKQDPIDDFLPVAATGVNRVYGPSRRRQTGGIHARGVPYNPINVQRAGGGDDASVQPSSAAGIPPNGRVQGPFRRMDHLFRKSYIRATQQSAELVFVAAGHEYTHKKALDEQIRAELKYQLTGSNYRPYVGGPGAQPRGVGKQQTQGPEADGKDSPDVVVICDDISAKQSLVEEEKQPDESTDVQAAVALDAEQMKRFAVESDIESLNQYNQSAETQRNVDSDPQPVEYDAADGLRQTVGLSDTEQVKHSEVMESATQPEVQAEKQSEITFGAVCPQTIPKVELDSSYSSSRATVSDDDYDYGVIPTVTASRKFSQFTNYNNELHQSHPESISFSQLTLSNTDFDPVFNGYVQPGSVREGDIFIESDGAYASSDDVEITMPVGGDQTPPPNSDWMRQHPAAVMRSGSRGAAERSPVGVSSQFGGENSMSKGHGRGSPVNPFLSPDGRNSATGLCNNPFAATRPHGFVGNSPVMPPVGRGRILQMALANSLALQRASPAENH